MNEYSNPHRDLSAQYLGGLSCWLHPFTLRRPMMYKPCCIPLLFPVAAVYDVTLNFKDQQTPTLLGIVQGKKYKADLKIK